MTCIGFEVPDKWLASILLAGLPNNFQPMIIEIESGGAKLTVDIYGIGHMVRNEAICQNQ